MNLESFYYGKNQENYEWTWNVFIMEKKEEFFDFQFVSVAS